jgi:hypothetical protein
VETPKPRILKSQNTGLIFTFSELREMFCVDVLTFVFTKPQNPEFQNPEIRLSPLPFRNFGKCFVDPKSDPEA